MPDVAERILLWPPRKEDLERLYLIEKLSAAKIANVYGLKYKSPKVAESAVLHQLKRHGVKRRDPAETVRKVTEEMVDEWASRYEAGESLKQIARVEVSPVTVFLHLRRRGVALRDKVEAQIRAVTKYERRKFSGNAIEKAYLMGLRYGDLHVVGHGRAIRVRVSTTHPAMAELFETLFSSYGQVHKYPRRARLVEYEWTLECDLDASFEFLLNKPSIRELGRLSRSEFVAFLSGFFDAEGAVLLHKKRLRYNPEVAITNSDKSILAFLSDRLDNMGYSAKTDWRKQREDRGGVTGEGWMGRLVVWRFGEVQELLRLLALRHREKIAKADLVLGLVYSGSDSNQAEIVGRWLGLKASIRRERDGFLKKASSMLKAR